MKELWIVALGVLLHALYMLSIFDIYFKSPIVHGMDPVHPRIQAPAKRLVLFVADGMRADKFFELKPDGTSRAPFLQSVIRSRGRWGVSHARPPTESRPGHVAIIAGFYEDPSAVTKGWKANPVEFDSVFNRSTKTLAFGSPDIVPIFCSNVDHAEYAAYPHEYEDFATDASFLDVWAFEQFEKRLNSSKELVSALQSDGLVVFLHLLGCDTNGHAHRPYSSIYLKNIEVVDRGVERIFNIMEQKYGDQQTAYVFTADHGMSDKGSHGDGDPANTETPLVAWGAGIRGPSPASSRTEKDDGVKFVDQHSDHMETPKAWGLDHLERVDVNQGDIAPLMSLVLGLPCPLNSVGVLPRGYLSFSEVNQVEAMFANAGQILNQFLLKSHSKQAVTLFFKPFNPLEDSDGIVSHIRHLITEKQYQRAMEESQKLIKLSLEGLHYFQTYDWWFLMGTISMGYLGWMTYLLMHLLKNYTKMWPKKRARGSPLLVRSFWGTTMAVLTLKLLLERSPWLYFLYAGMTCFLWEQVSHDIRTLLTLWSGARNKLSKRNLLSTSLVSLLIVQLLVVSFFNREVYTGIFLTAGVLGGIVIFMKLPTFSVISAFVLASCWFLSGFTLMPTQISENTLLVVTGCCLALLLSIGAWFVDNTVPKERILQPLVYVQPHRVKRTVLLFSTQAFLLVLSAGMVWITTSFRNHRRSLPVAFQILNWSLAGFSMILPLKAPPTVLTRLSSVFLGFAPSFMLLSIGYEAFFYSGLGAVLMSWILVESALAQDPSTERLVQWDGDESEASCRPIKLRDVHVAVCFLVLINVAFFGTGNFASIASFEISSVYRFITIFDPFVMAGLLLFKLFIPFILVTCAFSVVVKILQVPRLGCYFMVLLLSDVMTIQFFFLVRNTGSWMEIGNSISHFGIMSAQVIFVLLLFAASHIFTRDVKLNGRADLLKQF